MKRNWTVPALILAFVVVVGGAALLYRSLAGDTSATLTAEPGAGEPAATATPEPDSSSEAHPRPGFRQHRGGCPGGAHRGAGFHRVRRAGRAGAALRV